jgi:iron only hydrogenase large subunit-like protein
MIEKVSLLHSIRIDETKCIGCVTCMKVCPTKAIRVRNQKAKINYERCIDCGECLRVCSYSAIVPVITTSADLDRFKYKIALPSPVIYSQFGHQIMPNEILAVLKEIGFDHVYDEALVCEMVALAIEVYLDENKLPRPVISSTCPVVVRLIQRLFPSLCKNIAPIEPPREIAAKNLRDEISKEKNIPKEDIGIIHITPCAAKMVSINHPATMKRSFLDGAISIRDIYNTIMMRIKKLGRPSILQTQNRISGIGIGWSIPGGEIRALKYHNCVSVSGLYDTIKILEDVESGKLKDIEYLECLICPDGCVGGPLTVENRFIAKSNALRLIRMYGGKKRVDSNFVKKLYNDKFFSFESSVQPKPFPPLDMDRTKAIEKLKLKDKIVRKLTGKDCGLCGAPDCITFSEDVVRGEVQLEDCIYIKMKRNKREENHEKREE